MMRLRRLRLPFFKNLREFEITFGEDSVTTIVGRNGTGKSNILEALTVIFRDLDLGNAPAFEYDVAWQIRGKTVEVAGRPSAKVRHQVRVDGKRTSLVQLRGPGPERLLPRFVFGYYSGPSNRMEEHFLAHQRRFYRDLLTGRQEPLRPLFFARPVHAQFVLLAFFLANDPHVAKFLRDYLRIVDFDSVTFVLNEPPWAARNAEGRFWNARGTVAGLHESLYDASLYPMRRYVPLESGLGKSSQRELFWLYLPDLASVQQVRATYDSDQEFFKALESMLISELFESVRVRVKTIDSASTMSFRELSEGEQQLLMVLGLLRFTDEEDSLLLLDEPDTHLNPAWSVEYLRLLTQYGFSMHNSNIVVVTHDPLVIADQVREDVRILRRDSDGVIRAALPEHDPRGQGVGGLLTSEIYGLESELDPTTVDQLRRLRELAVLEERSEADALEFASLSRRLRHLDMSFVTRDPLYAPFVREMTRRRSESLSYVLSAEELSQREAQTARVLDELLSDEL